MSALIVLNPGAHGGTAEARWDAVAGVVTARTDARLVRIDETGQWRDAVGHALAAGVRTFVAAGGDGTVGAVTDAIVERRAAVPLGAIVLGAVGLGSSNDFHKPLRTVVRGVPMRLDVERAVPRDVARVRWVGEDGAQHHRVFLVSASLGVTAAANAFFNRPDRVLAALKRRWTGAAIAYAALRTLAAHRNVPAILRIGGAPHAIALSNLSVLKTPHLSGSLTYDTPVDPAGGRLVVNLCEGLSRVGVLATLAALARGRFRGRPGTRTWEATAVDVETAEPVDLELDGEVVRARRARFDLLPERIRTCP